MTHYIETDSFKCQGYEKGILWEYDPNTDEWAQASIIIHIQSMHFSKGLFCTVRMAEVLRDIFPDDTPSDPLIVGYRT